MSNTDTFVVILSSVFIIAMTYLTLVMIIQKSRGKDAPKRFKYFNRSLCVISGFCLLPVAEYISIKFGVTKVGNATEMSVIKLLAETVTSPHISSLVIALFPILYMLYRVPTKGEINVLQNSITTHNEAFQRHMERYHQK